MSRKAIDMTGKQCGKLLVIERSPSSSKRESMWLCRCDCGNTHVATGSHLRSGDVSSCGCAASRKNIGLQKIQKSLAVDEKEYLAKNSLQSESGCIEWAGSVFQSGYGAAHVRGKQWAAHRLSYTVFKGEIGKGLFVCHSCDNRKCINPEHLFLGTQQDNMTDKVLKGRHSHGETSGLSKLKETNVIEILSSGESNQSLARKFGVTTDHVAAIRKRKMWKHIELEGVAS